jgi:superfamily II DNA or RNA helicase
MMTFRRMKPKYGAALSKSRGRSRQEYIETYLYNYDEDKDRLYTYAGFLTSAVALLRGYNIDVEIVSADTNPFDFEPFYDAISDIQLRKSQEEMLAVILSCDRAQLNGLTAMGKSFLIKQAVRLFPYYECKVVIAAQQRPIVDAFYRDLRDMFPGEVGIVGCGCNNPNRITVSTAKSLMKCDVEKTRILFYDEVHTAGAEKVSKDLTNFLNARMYGFSASTECRTDQANAMVEALFGPVRITISYQQGVDEGIVPEIDTHFYRVHLDEFNHSNPTIRKRKQTWNNADWNAAVASVARHWENEEGFDDPQILIITDSMEHVIRLGALLPEYEWVYATSDKKRIDRFKKWGILPQDWQPEKPKVMKDKIQKIEAGGIRKVIATTTLGTGVDLRHLDIMIRADGGSSEISNIQFRGRATRGDHGVYCDFMVVGDKNCRNKSLARRRSCQRAGWTVKEEAVP